LSEITSSRPQNTEFLSEFRTFRSIISLLPKIPCIDLPGREGFTLPPLISLFQGIVFAPMAFEVQVEIHERIKRFCSGWV
jgi:hypothetical protein